MITCTAYSANFTISREELEKHEPLDLARTLQSRVAERLAEQLERQFVVAIEADREREAENARRARARADALSQFQAWAEGRIARGLRVTRADVEGRFAEIDRLYGPIPPASPATFAPPTPEETERLESWRKLERLRGVRWRLCPRRGLVPE